MSNRKNFWKISSFQILIMFRRGLFYSFLSIYLRYILGLSVTETTLFATLPMVINIVFQSFIWGNISDKFQKRRTLIILGEFSAAAGTVLTWYFHRFYLGGQERTAGYIIIIGLTVIEIFWSMSNLGWTAIISDIFVAKTRAAVRGSLASIGGMGRILGVLFGGLAYDGLGIHPEGWGFESGLIFFVAAGIMTISSIPIFFLPEGGVRNKEDMQEEKKDKLLSPEERRRRTKLFILFIFALAFINFGRNSIATIKAQYFTLDEGMAFSSRMLSYIVNMHSLAIIILGPFVGKMVKRIREHWLLFGGGLIAFIHLLGFAFLKSTPLIFFMNFLGGMAHVIILASSYAVASIMIPPSKRARLFAVYNATNFLSWGIAGTFITGPVADLLMKHGYASLQAYRCSFVVASFLTLIGLALIFVFNIKEKRIEKVRR
ncbi:MAG: MFS transporter [Candidatus Cloacimonadota bacterium]|nr:MFS transporter [Candidatus Cloacimonadota bacterium]